MATHTQSRHDELAHRNHEQRRRERAERGVVMGDRSPEHFARLIDANVNDYYRDAVTWDEFEDRARKIWAAAVRERCADDVSAILMGVTS